MMIAAYLLNAAKITCPAGVLYATATSYELVQHLLLRPSHLLPGMEQGLIMICSSHSMYLVHIILRK